MLALIVDNDSLCREATRLSLQASGIDFECAVTAAVSLQMVQERGPGSFDIILVDGRLARDSEGDLLTELRRRAGDLPILFLSPSASLEDRVRALRLGADDYITTPVQDEELVARMQCVVRRHLALPKIRFGALSLDLARRRVQVHDQALEFSSREFAVLLLLVKARGGFVSREQLLAEVWSASTKSTSNVANVHISRLRRKLEGLEGTLIETVRGKGYRITSHGSRLPHRA